MDILAYLSLAVIAFLTGAVWKLAAIVRFQRENQRRHEDLYQRLNALLNESIEYNTQLTKDFNAIMGIVQQYPSPHKAKLPIQFVAQYDDIIDRYRAIPLD